MKTFPTDADIERATKFKKWFDGKDLSGYHGDAYLAITAFLDDIERANEEPPGNRPMTHYEIAMHKVRMEIGV
jgi:hypothetical protein